jgi:hypothetical protein
MGQRYLSIFRGRQALLSGFGHDDPLDPAVAPHGLRRAGLLYRPDANIASDA